MPGERHTGGDGASAGDGGRPGDLDDALDDLARGQREPSRLAEIGRALRTSAQAAGTRAVATGRWLAELVIDLTPRIPVRDRATLEAEHGLTGTALAEELTRRASRASAAVGAASGALISVEELAPPAWVLIPAHLVVETLAVAVVELRLLGELHEVYGRPIAGSPDQRSTTLVRAWAERRGVTAATLGRPGGLAETLGRGARQELVRLVRRRVMARLGRNVSSVAPLLAGAAAGAEVNRRATLALGAAIRRDLEAADGRGGPSSS